MDSAPSNRGIDLSSGSFSTRVAKRTSFDGVPGERGVSDQGRAGTALEVSSEANVGNVNLLPTW